MADPAAKPLTPDEKISLMGAQMTALYQNVSVTNSALARLITLVEPLARANGELAPILADVKARFFKDGRITFPGIFG